MSKIHRTSKGKVRTADGWIKLKPYNGIELVPRLDYSKPCPRTGYYEPMKIMGRIVWALPGGGSIVF